MSPEEKEEKRVRYEEFIHRNNHLMMKRISRHNTLTEKHESPSPKKGDSTYNMSFSTAAKPFVSSVQNANKEKISQRYRTYSGRKVTFRKHKSTVQVF